MKVICSSLLLFLGLNSFAHGYGYNVEDNESAQTKKEEISQSPFTKYGDNQFEYCEIVGQGKIFSFKVDIFIDYGQNRKFFDDPTIMKDEKGNKIVFNSMIDALNYMGKLGWELHIAYAVAIQNLNIYHWILKRKRKV